MNHRLSVFIVLCCVLLAACKDNAIDKTSLQPPIVPDQKEYIEVVYAMGSSAQKLDIFLPTSGTAPFPVLMWIHGGGWKGGDKAEFRTTNRKSELLKRGYAVVVINYRLSGEAKFPTQIYDVKAAIRWVKANATTYAMNAEKIGVWGSSAGGHLSALAGVSGNVPDLEDMSQGNSGFSSNVQVVIDWYGPVDLLKMDEMAIAQGCSGSTHNAATSAESELVGYQITTQPALVANVSPLTYITSDDPPIFMEHGLLDCTVAYNQSQLLYDQLLPVLGGEKLKLKFLANTGHGGGLFGDNDTITEAIDFLDIYLK